MEIGKLNRRITIRSYAASTETAYGGVTRSAPVDYNTWAKANRLSQSEVLANGLKLGEAVYRFGIRYQDATKVTQRNEIIYEGKTFRVLSVINIDEANFYTEVIASERTN